MRNVNRKNYWTERKKGAMCTLYDLVSSLSGDKPQSWLPEVYESKREFKSWGSEPVLNHLRQTQDALCEVLCSVPTSVGDRPG